MPKISVGVSAYNRKDYLRESLNSLLNQTIDDYEIIVVDDGSTDGTGEMVQREFPSVRYIYKENGGDASAKNRAAEAAGGKYLVYLDSDDLFYPDSLERLLAPLEVSPVPACSYGMYVRIDEHGNELKTKLKLAHYPSGNILPDLVRHIIVCNCGFLFPLEDFHKNGPFDTAKKVGYDYEFALKMARDHYFYYIDEPVFKRRRHGTNLSAASYAKQTILRNVVETFCRDNANLKALSPRLVRERLAALNLAMAREARRENLGPEVVHAALREALDQRFSLKTLFRLWFW